jgi:Fic family protein
MIMDPYIPQSLPVDLSKLHWENVALKVSEASAALAYYNGILESIVNPSIFLSPLETKEAVLSSRIEGTITTVDEVLKYQVDIKPDSISKQDDVIEVLNYRKGTQLAKDWIQRGLPINLTLICAIQRELLQGVRGKDKHPGEVRTDQVWIGPKGCSIEEATYVPPEPLGLRSHLDNFVDYLNRTDQEALIQTAIAHAQFEIIHPFDDGNGRTGRILIPLFLWCRQRISSPMFYISEYFDENRDTYVENLRRLSEDKDWERWIVFFLEAISVQARRNSQKANQILSLYQATQKKVADLTRSPYALQVVDALFTSPILKTPDFIKLADLERKSAHRIIAKLKESRVLITVTKPSGRSPEVLMFDELFQIIR